MKVNILGAEYSVTVSNGAKEPRLTDCDGFCDETTHEIFADDYQNIPDGLRFKAKPKNPDKESPLAQNEELVDWIAIQGPKLYKAWKEAGAV